MYYFGNAITAIILFCIEFEDSLMFKLFSISQNDEILNKKIIQ